MSVPLRVLVTGGAGFIGSHVTTALIEAGHQVRVLDSLHPAAWRDARPQLHPSAELIVGDVTDAALVSEALDGADVVCHHAAMVGMGVDVGDMPAYVANNDLGTAVVLAAMSTLGIGRLVLASSMVVYGDGRYRCSQHGDVRPAARSGDRLALGEFDPACPRCGRSLSWVMVDEDTPLEPRSLYAATKTAQEHLAAAWARATGGSVIALRYHNVYGPQMPRDTPYAGVAAIFRSALESGRAPRVFEDGLQTRDFVHVSDVARVNALAVSRAPARGFEPFNIASGLPVTLLEMATVLSQAAGGPAPLVTGEHRAGDVRHIVASARRARDILGFRAAVTPLEGLRAFAIAPLRGDRPAVTAR
jgi:dTDP-L-rhamnose 4-epimerase